MTDREAKAQDPDRRRGCCRSRSSAGPAILLAGVAFLLTAGCATTQPGPTLLLRAWADKDAYQIGEPVVTSVWLNNEGPDPVMVPRFDARALRFLLARKESAAQVVREPVYSLSTVSEPSEIAPGSSLFRRFLFTRLTEEEGEYALLTSFKGAMTGRAALAETVYSEAVSFRVVEPTALRRDPANGLILKAQAVELAERTAQGEVKASRAVLVPLEKTGLYTWVVFLRTAPPDGPEEQYAVQVSPYTGKVAPLTLDLPIEGPDEEADVGTAEREPTQLRPHQDISRPEQAIRPGPSGELPQEGGE